eukprot:TRINITY_DN919_c0_g1_i3.p1 TRINITY_DN919_c0_g1~~TRINITY_DN919_c0_g1_i3.p1  ORF type:complete len:603 (+),score=144.62 TRINITY_DN919_c0_g1_i3:133-1809(+)
MSELGKTKENIAFIVDGKNEILVKDFIFKNYSEIRYFDILVTNTDSNAVGTLNSESEERMVFLSSLAQKGDENIIKQIKTSKNIQAVIILNYPSISKALPIDRLQKLINCCSVNDVALIFNPSLAKDYIGLISSVRAITHGEKKGISLSNDNISAAYLTIYPSFDDPMSESTINVLKKRDQIGFRFLQKLEIDGFSFLVPVILPQVSEHMRKVFLDDPKNKNNTFTEQNIDYDEYATEETAYFTIDDTKHPGVAGLYYESGEPIPLFQVRLSGFVPEDFIFKCLFSGVESPLREHMNHAKLVRDFLVGMKLFYEPNDLIDIFRKWYDYIGYEDGELTQEQLEMELDLSAAPTIKKIIKDWLLMEYCSDFRGKPELCKYFEDFINEVVRPEDDSYADDILEMFHNILDYIKFENPVLKGKPPKVIPKKKKNMGPEILSYDPLEIARQLTLLDQSHFRKIKACEFVGAAWTKRDAMVRAPNLTRFIDHTNRILQFVLTETLKTDVKDIHTLFIQHWIRVAKCLYEMNNFNSMVTVLSALNGAVMSRLKAAWEVFLNRIFS